MAECVRCQHMDDLHAPVGDGLGACTQGDGCPLYIEAVASIDAAYMCGVCGALLVDFGPHTTWHLA